MNPYLPIRKVPLDYNGISSSAFAVQMQHPAGNTTPNAEWKETGVVGNSYMLLHNEEVKDAAHQVAEECNIDFVHDKTFFNVFLILLHFAICSSIISILFSLFL